MRVAAGPQAQDGEKLTLRLLDRASLKGFDELFKRHQDVGDYLAQSLSPEIKGRWIGDFIRPDGFGEKPQRSMRASSKLIAAGSMF